MQVGSRLDPAILPPILRVMFKLALSQMPILGGHKEANLQAAEANIAAAANARMTRKDFIRVTSQSSPLK